MGEQISMYQAAVEYINLGLAVFPLREKQKTPLTKNGFKDATTDAAQVKAWWQAHPDANIGIATGMKSGGLVVIDLDVDENKGINGYHTLQDWMRENGEFPESWTSITGRGGYHLFFKTDEEIHNRAGILDGIDVRGEGGYIVAPPSLHQNGHRYEWEYAPEDIELSPVTEIVSQFLEIGKKRKDEHFQVPASISKGKRNWTLFRTACMMQSKGFSDSAIYSAVKVENEEKCNPPVPEDEVIQAVESALKYEKGKPIYIDENGDLLQGYHEPVFALTQDGTIKNTVDNMAEAIEFDKDLYGKIKYNKLSYAPFIVGPLPWEHKHMYREWNNADDANLRCYLEKRYNFKGVDKMMDALSIVTNRNKFNPVIDMLEGLFEKWDGAKGHIDNLLPDYLGVEKNEYSCESMKLFMLGAISRAYKPGCKFDYVPILEGKQGCGKSTFIRYLAMNNDWYSDNFNTLEGDKAFEKLRGMWMVELAELLATKKAKEIESTKAFLTSTIDTYRPPYGRRSEQRPRVCVFAGTTNNQQFLTDRTGNRRYLPLKCRKEKVKKSMFENMESVIDDFEQAWGEAMYYFKAANENPRLILPKDLNDYVEKIQESYLEEDVRVGVIQQWLDLNKHVDRVCALMIYQEALGNDCKPKRMESNDIHDIMANSIHGWHRLENSAGGRGKCGRYGTQICYERDRVSVGEFESSTKDNPFVE